MDRDLLTYRPDLTVICYGLNDCGGGDDGIPEYKSNLTAIVRKALDAGSEAIVMTPSPICTRVHTQLRGEALRQLAADLAGRFADGTFGRYMDAARKAAEETGVPLCDCFAKWELLRRGGVDVTSLLSNYLNHPVREMHALCAYSLTETMFTAP
jgi:lysophospholipase L1-like esterase